MEYSTPLNNDLRDACRLAMFASDNRGMKHEAYWAMQVEAYTLRTVGTDPYGIST